NSGIANGNKIQIWTCNGTGAQSVTISADHSVQILGHCLDVNQSGTANNSIVQLWGCNGTGAQKWTFNASNKTLVNPESGRCLTDPGGSTSGAQVVIFDCSAGSNQQWTLPGAVTGPIASGIAGKCVDIRNSGTADGTPVQLYDCNGTNAQSWTLAGDG